MAMYTTAASSSTPNESDACIEEDTASIDVDAKESCLKAAKHDPLPFVSERTKLRAAYRRIVSLDYQRLLCFLRNYDGPLGLMWKYR